jgi:hypothetical protein
MANSALRKRIRAGLTVGTAAQLPHPAVLPRCEFLCGDQHVVHHRVAAVAEPRTVVRIEAQLGMPREAPKVVCVHPTRSMVALASLAEPTSAIANLAAPRTVAGAFAIALLFPSDTALPRVMVRTSLRRRQATGAHAPLRFLGVRNSTSLRGAADALRAHRGARLGRMPTPLEHRWPTLGGYANLHVSARKAVRIEAVVARAISAEQRTSGPVLPLGAPLLQHGSRLVLGESHPVLRRSALLTSEPRAHHQKPSHSGAGCTRFGGRS